ncbi:hypothetical protein NC653_034569 [Populus alba x Populus x berolinensis]|uniref:Uncharacterized protein n=1 Tax=Populus alba x Populus x berolinensis TaxID=444605 RepID=A0AAD6LMY8_9ROSI|nr:hypothetical protein NC653_034569 [Populus alba x Populus x berolinensis]
MQSASTNKNSKAKCFNSSNQFPATEKHGQGKELKTKYFKQIKYSKQRPIKITDGDRAVGFIAQQLDLPSRSFYWTSRSSTP